MTEIRTSAVPYDDAFYQRYVEGMASSAAHVLRIVYSFYQPRSVLDVGCGRGAWLAAAGALGASSRHGLDGPWVKTQDLLDPAMTFSPVDFEKPLPRFDQRFELAMSLEVAEHISEPNADDFIASLCGASDVVLFGAAIRHQGGDHHVNEQRQSYWVTKFAARGYVCHDVIRAAVWDLEAVKWWYRQNTFLFVRKGSTSVDELKLHEAVHPITDIVHPAIFESRSMKLARFETPTLRDCTKVVSRYLRRALRRVLGMEKHVS